LIEAKVESHKSSLAKIGEVTPDYISFLPFYIK